MTFSVSHSKMKTWRRCRKAYDYRYVQKLRPRRKGRPLVFGSIVHEMIEAHAYGDDPKEVLAKYRKEVKKLFSSEREEYLEIVADAESLMIGYFNFYKNDGLKFISLNRKSAEHEFEVPLTDGINIVVKIDGICRTKDKRIWIAEHKSHKEVPDEEVRMRDIQTIIYETILLDQPGIERIDGVMWDYIRSKTPTVPKLLKDGTMSKAKIDTLPHIYREELLKHKLSLTHYQDVLESLTERQGEFFQRIFMPINRTMANQLMTEFITTSKEMRDGHGKDATRNLTRDCSWCEFKQLCMAELLGNDADFIRKREFTQNDTNRKENKKGK